MDDSSKRGRLVAIVTGTFSVLLGILYLILINFLDSRGPMLPPPPEALAEVEAYASDFFVEVQQPFVWQFLEIS